MPGNDTFLEIIGRFFKTPAVEKILSRYVTSSGISIEIVDIASHSTVFSKGVTGFCLEQRQNKGKLFSHCLLHKADTVMELPENEDFLINECAHGFTHAFVPFFCQGKIVANIYTGHVLTREKDPGTLKQWAYSLDIGTGDLDLLLEHVRSLSKEQLENRLNQLADLSRLLSHSLERDIEIEKLYNDLEEVRQLKSSFLSNVIYNLRTPLDGILGYTNILKKAFDTSVYHKDSIGIIEQCGNQLLDLINDLQDITHIESRNLELKSELFNLVRGIEGLVVMYQIRAKQKGLLLSFELISGFPENVYGDEKRIHQILNNLLSNAVKYTEDGMITLKMGYWDQSVHVDLEDTGLGMPVLKVKNLFNPVAQREPKERRYSSSGLGLMVTKKLLDIMGGTMEVFSEEKKGSRFIVTIPLESRGPGPDDPGELFTGKQTLEESWSESWKTDSFLPRKEQVQAILNQALSGDYEAVSRYFHRIKGWSQENSSIYAVLERMISGFQMEELILYLEKLMQEYT